MKKQILCLILNLVPVFGLISCNSDENIEEGRPKASKEVEPENQVVVDILFLQEDGSFKNVDRNLQALTLSSQLKVSYDQKTVPKGELRSQVSCHTSQRQEKLSKEVQLPLEKIGEKIKISSLLPPRSLNPLSGEKSVFCDFSIEFKNETHTMAQILLENIEIQGIKTYSDWDILPGASDLERGIESVFRINELDKFRLSFDDMATVYTVCDNEDLENFNSENQVELSSFFNGDLFEKRSLISCRLISKNESDQAIRVSQVIKILGRWSNIQIKAQTHFQKNERPIRAFSNALVFNITNKGSASGLVSFKTSKNSHVNIRPYYGNPLPEGKIGLFPEWSLPAHWILVDERRELENGSRIPIPPGETITIALEVQNGLSCPTGKPAVAPNVHKSVCSFPAYLGATVKMPHPIFYKRDQYGDPNETWEPLKSNFSKENTDTISFWNSNSNLTELCSRYPIVKKHLIHRAAAGSTKFQTALFDSIK